MVIDMLTSPTALVNKTIIQPGQSVRLHSYLKALRPSHLSIGNAILMIF